MFMVTKGAHVAFLLPVAHLATPPELDAYLGKVIVPVFKNATMLIDESAQLAHIPAFAYHPCPTELSPGNRVALERHFLETARVDGYQFPTDPDLVPNDFSKFMMVIFGPLNPGAELPPTMFYTKREQVSNSLAKRFGIPRQSIESVGELFQIFCALPDAQKNASVGSYLSTLDGFHRLNPDQEAKRFLGWLKRARQTLKAGALNDEVDNPEKADAFLLDGRNRLWANKIDAASQATGVPFYAFGAEHFAPDRVGPGLLRMLQEKGFTVKLIRHLGDIPSRLRQRFQTKSG